MKKTVYDTTRFAERMNGFWTLGYMKCAMLEAIGNIAVAVRDKDADRAIKIQTDLMWVYDALSTIDEKEVEI